MVRTMLRPGGLQLKDFTGSREMEVGQSATMRCWERAERARAVNHSFMPGDPRSTQPRSKRIRCLRSGGPKIGTGRGRTGIGIVIGEAGVEADGEKTGDCR